MNARVFLPTAMLLCGCLHHAPTPPAPARGPARDTLVELDRTRGAGLADHTPIDSLLAMFGENVVYLRAGAPAVYGVDGVRALFAANPAPLGGGVSWLPLGGGVSDDLHDGYTFGVAAHRAAAGREPFRFERYIAYWERGQATPWRIVAYAEIAGPAAGEVALTTTETTPPVPSWPKERADAAQRVRAADSLFSDVAYRLGLAVAFSGAIAPTGVVFGSPPLVVGPDAVREFYLAQGTGTSLSWHPVYAAAAASRDLGFTIGEYVATGLGPSGAAVQRFGKYLTVWKLQRDGTWKFLVDGGSPTK